MRQKPLLFLDGNQIVALLQGREAEILQAVRSAYQIHDRGNTNVPHSSFLRFPALERERIIALPAYLGGPVNVAGLKWIASFPDNVKHGLERASAVLLLNSMENGHLQAIFESSIISAKRTGASAALAAHTLYGPKPMSRIGVIGCGPINFETIRFLLAQRSEIVHLMLYDVSAERARDFMRKCQEMTTQCRISLATEPMTLFAEADVVALATNAVTPHIKQLPEGLDNQVILHTSLRDFAPEVILSAENIVDDIDHVCRADTSVHLTEKQVWNRDFIQGTIGQVLNGAIPARQDAKRRVIFSPFGLGILDLAVGKVVYDLAENESNYYRVESFLPTSWLDRVEKPIG
jgi:N-[(2S)-2-amino-2-carboxyethyl]-L-glutamate dehydrogenase